MRQTRIKVDAAEGVAVYHVISRTVNGERLLDDPAMEVLRKQIWQIADFCGVQVLTYTILSNHFHVLVRVPRTSVVSDRELLRRFALLHPKPTKYQSADLEVIKSQLASNGPSAIAWRNRQLALMGDVSMYMKLLKQRFTRWFNKSHQRFGTLWAERFKSVLLEGRGQVSRVVAAYIDLNPVRAGLVQDPKDYLFCGYAEAVVGNLVAQTGIQSLVEGAGTRGWPWAHDSYRMTLFGKGSRKTPSSASFDSAQLDEVVRSGGKLPLASVLRCRMRYFSEGAVLGSQAFVQTHLAAYRRSQGSRRVSKPKAVPLLEVAAEGITMMRGIRNATAG
jgi:putative transposase